MKRTLLVLALLLAGATAATPYLVGTEAEKLYQREVARLEQQADYLGIAHLQHQFQRGLFSSHATLTFDLQGASPMDTPVAVLVESELSHGPILRTQEGLSIGLYASSDRLSLQRGPEALMRFLQETLGEQLATASSRVGFDQVLHSNARIAPFRYQVPEGQLDFGGAGFTIEANLLEERSTGTISLNPLSIQSDGSSLELSQGSGDFDFQTLTSPLVVGDFFMRLEQLKISAPQLNLTLRGLTLTTAQRMIDGKLNLEERIAIESIDPPPLQAASYGFELSHLDPGALELWSDLALQVNQPLAEPSDSMEQEVRALISRTFQPGLRLDQTLHIEAYGGILVTDLNLLYRGVPDGQHLLDIQDPLLLLDAVDADLLVRADERVFEASPLGGTMELYLKQGLLTRNGNQLQLKGELREGALTLNGQPFPLRELLEQQAIAY
ncbi:DUF945 family protein [Aestuariirhabdus litorea]|uniref:DUF945 family protein n=1 Tax=Aestuariirhabdus litorea TaxID=2528527 RepID=A0A3P3VQH5_9GAMM|nr:DUF945 family protein [Aestuariirhabdus litorea]RRJ83073.1 DUF945 family protein [Aestuariirhabdus litorea]RWW93231.1 DUF945 family protein [Endozoicomonadaceae bacterium GTF-13]